MATRLFIIAAWFLFSACKPIHSSSNPNIINGADASGQFPEVVEIELVIPPQISPPTIKRSIKCTATFVSANTAVTAARCLTAPELTTTQPGVMVGTVTLTATKVAAVKGFFHPDFNP